jgi:hypothetical protein
MPGTTVSMISPMMPAGKLKQMLQPGQPIANQLLKNSVNIKVRMRKKKAIILSKDVVVSLEMITKKMNSQDLVLSLIQNKLGLEIKEIVHMNVNGKLRLIILLQEMLQHGLLYLKKNPSGDQFSMNRLNKHHQDIHLGLT